MPAVREKNYSPSVHSQQPDIRLRLGRAILLGLIICLLFTYYFYSPATINLTEDVHFYESQVTLKDLPQMVQEGYVVWSPSCAIPNLSANHPSIRKLISKTKRLTCSRHEPLTETWYNHSSGLNYIRLIKKNVPKYIVSGERWRLKLACCYKLITRKPIDNHTNKFDSPDDKYNLSKQVCFENDSIELPKEAEFVHVYCYEVTKKNGHRINSKNVYSDMYLFVVIRDEIRKRKTRQQLQEDSRRRLAGELKVISSKGEEDVVNGIEHGNSSSDTVRGTSVKEELVNSETDRTLPVPTASSLNVDDKTRTANVSRDGNRVSSDPMLPSVLLVGIDSVSRLNFIRSMPKTLRFLNERGWLPLEGYTKVGENTFPNLIPIFTGMSEKQLRKACYPDQKQEIDRCRFIWSEFQERGYVTAYVEDEPNIGTFNYHKYGFRKQPTDYYSRPFMLAAEKFLPVKQFDGLNFCLGYRSAPDYMLNYCRDFVRTFRDRPYFALFWMNSFSHNSVNTASSMDDEMERFFRDISTDLDQTIVIFLSDHGTRWGAIRQTFIGWLEDKMPFIYFLIPEAYRERYPDRYDNLRSNKNRLTSPFDLHAMLREILVADTVANPPSPPKPEGCSECDSLFRPIAWNRSCDQAGIPHSWCTCGSNYDPISHNSPTVNAIADFIMSHVNDLIRDANAHNQTKDGMECAKLYLLKIHSVRQKVLKSAGHPASYTEFIIVLETEPNGALYETNVRQEGHKLSVIDSVERINMYGGQSWCVTHSYYLKYCYCVKRKNRKQ